MHGILMLHDQIRTGELLKRREETGAGAGIEVTQLDGVPAEPVGAPSS
jgi:hypothetical protein